MINNFADCYNGIGKQDALERDMSDQEDNDEEEKMEESEQIAPKKGGIFSGLFGSSAAKPKPKAKT
jgi:hypothetical protein